MFSSRCQGLHLSTFQSDFSRQFAGDFREPSIQLPLLARFGQRLMQAFLIHSDSLRPALEISCCLENGGSRLWDFGASES